MGKRANQEGSIYQRSRDGLWAAAVLTPEGKRRVFYGKTQEGALTRKNQALRELAEGRPLPPERVKLAKHLQDWLEAIRPTVRAFTFRGYADIVRVHLIPGLGRYKLRELQANHIRAFLNAKLESGLSPRMVCLIHEVLRLAMKQAEADSLVSRNVVPLVARPRIRRKEVSPFDVEEANAFVRAIRGERFEALFLTAMRCGLREGEALALRWSDVDLDQRDLFVRATLQHIDGEWVFAEPKSAKSRRRVALPAQVIEALRAHRMRQMEERLKAGPLWQDWDLVFATHTGGPLDARNVVRNFQSVLKRAGLRRQRFHDLRHCAASLLAASGSSLKEIQEILGHSQISITSDLYTHIFEKAKREAIDRSDALFATV